MCCMYLLLYNKGSICDSMCETSLENLQFVAICFPVYLDIVIDNSTHIYFRLKINLVFLINYSLNYALVKTPQRSS